MDQRRARGERNRDALIAAAVALFSARGYEGTTVEQIAAEAGVAPRTLFHHFASKDDILFDGYTGRLDEATRRFRASESRSLWGALAEASNAVAEAISQQPDMFLVRAQMYAGHPALRATMLRLNDEWIDQLTGEVARWLGADANTDLRPRLAATVINGANRAAIDTWVAGGGADELTEIMQNAVDLVRPAIARIERTAARTRARQIG
ncbi:TetR family transcriptional regulator [Mycobacterium sp. 1245111.1]|uniref:TetR/AcrR family transcriptional regulator n=1 Tax=Mycobacterium sp. 1245111.1 TaxID=1834073 RepID=UPI0007FEF38D|nr:TetR/AcrR family transcriptional regulator [Mycobacterium sp. 1245111.1]OBK35315.1 TetR family transcriptional regulator [Mycobacterium sp. 1245111.1]